MKRTLTKIALIGCLLVLGFSLFAGAALADDGTELPSPGILPDSPFYFIDQIGKSLGMFFAFGDEAKAEKALRYAGERLAEARAMEEKGKDKQTEDAAREYDRFMARVQERLQAADQQGASDNLSERVALATARHLDVLDGLSENLTGPALEAIRHARDVSVNGQEQALRALARNRAERAAEIAGDTANAQLERLRHRVENGLSANVTAGLDIADRLAELEDQLIAKAEEQGIDPTQLRERLARSTSQRLEVLSRVYDRVPEKAREAISNAVGNSFEKYQRAIDGLDRGSSENLTDDDDASPAKVLEHIGEQLRDRLRLNSDNVTPPKTDRPSATRPAPGRAEDEDRPSVSPTATRPTRDR